MERSFAMIAEDSAELRNEFKRYYKKWDTIRQNKLYGYELPESAKNCRVEAGAAAFLRQWLAGRIEFLDSQWNPKH